MADDLYVPVVEADTALRAVHAAIEVRRGYLALIDQLLAPFPTDFQYDQKKRNQMITLLSRGDTLWVMFLVHAESPFASATGSNAAKIKRRNILGSHLTRATLARGIAIYETGVLKAKPERRHIAAAGRIVEAALSYGLIELGDQPDEKQKPIIGTQRLAKFVHALGDHAYWTMKEAVENTSQSQAEPLSGFGEASAKFEREDIARHARRGRITSSDAALALLDDAT